MLGLAHPMLRSSTVLVLTNFSYLILYYYNKTQATIGELLIIVDLFSDIDDVAAAYAAAYYCAMVSGGSKKKKLSELIVIIDLEVKATA